MTSTSSQLPELDRYLARHHFAPHAAHGTWLDRSTGQDIIRVVREPGEETQLIRLAQHSVCLYKAVFSPATPDTVIIAAIEAALSPPRARASRGRAGPSTGQRRTCEEGGYLRRRSMS